MKQNEVSYQTQTTMQDTIFFLPVQGVIETEP